MKRPKQRMLVCLVWLLLFTPACRGELDPEPRSDQINGAAGQEDQDLTSDGEPIIDGEIKQSEWQEALIFPFDDNSELLLLIKGETLYLAVRAAGGGMISGNVFLEEEGQISVLHTSAALGTALYQLDGEQYRKVKDFAWCCRSQIDNEISRAAREDFFLAEGWLGANTYLGVENELEFKISLPDGAGMLAVNFIYVEGDRDKHIWPAGLDDAVAQDMTGGFPELLEFSVGSWVSVEELK